MEMTTTDWIQAISTVVLVGVTAFYAWRTHTLSKATEKQAKANIQMAEEMREQRIMTSRPWIIQRAVNPQVIPSELSSEHFEIYNAGNGPAIEVEICIVRKRDFPYEPYTGQRESFIRVGDLPIRFDPQFPKDIDNSTFYIVSEYQSTFLDAANQTWYQTWLPCKLSVSGRVICGKLEFDEVKREKRIGLFNTNF